MKYSITYTPTEIEFGPIVLRNLPVERAFEIAGEYGYDGLEIHLRRPDDLDWKEVKKISKTSGIQVITIGTGMAAVMDGLTLADSNPKIRRQAIDLVKRHIENAADVGSCVTIGFLNGKIGRPVNSQRRQDVVECYCECSSFAEKHNVTILCEPLNRYECDYLNTVNDGLALIKDVKSPNVKLLSDTFHMNIEEKNISESLKQAGSFVGYVHLADSNRYMPGSGHIDFREILKTLADIKYDGFAAFECIPDDNPMVTVKSAIAYLKSLNNKI